MFLATHAQGKAKPDVIFDIARKANERSGQVQNVVNGTLGVLLDDEKKLVTFPSIETMLMEMESVQWGAYAPIAGMPGLMDAYKHMIMGNEGMPNHHFDGIATMGGTGALKIAAFNLLEKDEALLTSSIYWGPYNAIARENDRKVHTFELFNQDGNLNTDDFARQVSFLAENQSRVLIFLNFPAHNPTGYSPTKDEWQTIVDSLNEISQKSPTPISLLLDMAYVDFVGDQSERDVWDIMGGLSERIPLLLAISQSKSYVKYGLRSGSLMVFSPNQDIVDELQGAFVFSCRGNWSNGVRAGQELLLKLHKDNLFELINQERKPWVGTLSRRGKIFYDEALKCGLPVLPYRSGFFITCPNDDPVAAQKKLEKEDIFVVPLAGALRVAVCSLSEKQLEGLATRIYGILSA